MKVLMITAFAFLVLFSQGCKEQSTKQTAAAELQSIFPKGELGPAENFTGKAWNYGLVPNDTTYTTLVGNFFW